MPATHLKNGFQSFSRREPVVRRSVRAQQYTCMRVYINFFGYALRKTNEILQLYTTGTAKDQTMSKRQNESSRDRNRHIYHVTE